MLARWFHERRKCLLIDSISISSLMDVKVLTSIMVSRIVLPDSTETTITGNDVVKISVMSEVTVSTTIVGTRTEVVERTVTSRVVTLNVGTTSTETDVTCN
jgi:hypothetical protein